MNESKAATIYDIAKEAQVSTATVSRVLNNPEVVSEKTKIRVHEAIEKLSYAPNALARELVTKSTNLIGLLIPDIANSFSPALIDQVVHELESNGYNIFLSITGGDPDREAKSIELMLKKRCEGIILLAARQRKIYSNKIILKLSQKNVPIVILDYFENESKVCCIRCDEEKGAEMAVQYLVEHGHKKIAMINGNENLSTYYFKRKGFLNALKQHGIAVNGDYIKTVEPYFQNGYEAAKELLECKPIPTAVFVSGEQMAVGAYKAIQEKGLKVGADISVVGFSGSRLSKAVYPAMTTISQKADELGILAAGSLIQQIDGEKPMTNILQPEIIIRDSVCSKV